MRLVLPALAVCAFGLSANADVLWDQSNINPDVNSIVDQEFGDFPTYSSYMANDFEVDGPGWHITKMTVYFTNQNGGWNDTITSGRFNFHSKAPYPDCSFPTVDADQGDVVPITLTPDANGWAISTDLDIYVGAGEAYWIGLTPIADFGVYSQEFHRAAPIVGCNTAWQNPGGSFGYGADWTYAYVLDSTGTWEDAYDMAMLIEGYYVPAPGALALLGLAGLARRRRR